MAVAHTLRARGAAHLTEAEAEYSLARSVARELGSVSFEVAAQIGLASIALQKGDPVAAATLVREATDLAEGAGLGHLRDRALRLLAETTTVRQPEADTIPPRIN